MTELKDLTGLHKLSGVDYETKQVKEFYGDRFEDCQVVNFTLDGITYSAVEDPEDGYRSCMRDLVITQEPLTNVFASCDVFCIYVEKEEYYKMDVLEIHDAKNSKLVLRVGTENTDDYYPCFISEWIPENLSINQNGVDQKGKETL